MPKNTIFNFWLEFDDDDTVVLCVQSGTITASLQLNAQQAQKLGNELVESARALEG